MAPFFDRTSQDETQRTRCEIHSVYSIDGGQEVPPKSLISSALGSKDLLPDITLTTMTTPSTPKASEEVGRIQTTPMSSTPRTQSILPDTYAFSNVYNLKRPNSGSPSCYTPEIRSSLKSSPLFKRYCGLFPDFSDYLNSSEIESDSRYRFAQTYPSQEFSPLATSLPDVSAWHPDWEDDSLPVLPAKAPTLDTITEVEVVDLTHSPISLSWKAARNLKKPKISTSNDIVILSSQETQREYPNPHTPRRATNLGSQASHEHKPEEFEAQESELSSPRLSLALPNQLDYAVSPPSIPTSLLFSNHPPNKITIRERKRIIVSHSRPSALTTSMTAWITQIQRLLDPFREDYECWFHPNPPSPLVTSTGSIRPFGVIKKLFGWTDPKIKVKSCIVLNYGIVNKIINYTISKREADGFVNRKWHLSHLCGNWTCLNPRHTCVEEGRVNAERNGCFSHRYA